MLGAFGKLSLLWRLLSILGALAAVGGTLWGVYAIIRHQGYLDGEAAARAICEAEKATQRKANQDAIDASNRRMQRVAEELANKDMEIDDAVAAALAAAAADPTGARECLPLGSVQRLSPIR